MHSGTCSDWCRNGPGGVRQDALWRRDGGRSMLHIHADHFAREIHVFAHIRSRSTSSQAEHDRHENGCGLCALHDRRPSNLWLCGPGHVHGQCACTPVRPGHKGVRFSLAAHRLRDEGRVGAEMGAWAACLPQSAFGELPKPLRRAPDLLRLKCGGVFEMQDQIQTSIIGSRG